jgi:hypothetical protein
MPALTGACAGIFGGQQFSDRLLAIRVDRKLMLSHAIHPAFAPTSSQMARL